MLNTLPSCEKTMSETGFGCQWSSIVMGFSNWSRPCLEKVHRKGKHGDTRLHVHAKIIFMPTEDCVPLHVWTQVLHEGGTWNVQL